MPPIATLRSSGGELVTLSDTTVAVLSPTSACTIAVPAGGEPTVCVIPPSITSYTLWLPPTVEGTAAPMVVAATATGTSYVLTLHSPSGAITALDVPDLPEGRLLQLVVYSQTVLLVRTVAAVGFYLLDPILAVAGSTTRSLVRMGGAALPAAQDVWIVGSTVEKELLVTCWTGARVHAILFGMRGAAAVVEGRTTPDGLPVAADTSVVSCGVRWSQQEVLFLAKDSSATLLRLSIRDLSTWATAPSAVLTAATRLMLLSATAIHCTADEVWAIDALTGPGVAVRNMTSVTLSEEVLEESSVSAATTVTAAGGRLYVMNGKRMYRVGTATRSKASGSMGEWLAQRKVATVAACRSNEEAGNAESASVVRRLTSKEATVAADRRVVRDCVYVQGTRHAILDILCTVGNEVSQSTLLLRYVSLTESLHPMTVVRVLHQKDEALVLALASQLARKAALRDGGLARWNALRHAAAAYLAQLPSSFARKAYTATCCRASMAALAGGALGAVRVLLAVADVCVAEIYGVQQAAEAASSPSTQERELEKTISEAISLFASYSEWALGSASSALGVMTAHTGDPSSLRKEACLRDGKAHAIQTSRAVDIEPLRLLQRPG